MTTDPARVQELFLAALDLPDSAARAAHLDATCGDDVEVRERVEALLRAHDTPDSLLDAPVVPPPGGDSPTRTHATDTGSPDAVPDPGAGFELGEEIGRGAGGVVYRALQRGLNRVVAVKLALGWGVLARHALARFLAEAEAVASIDHPHVVRVHGYGQRDGVPYIAMEYLSGGTLADRLKAGPLQECDAAELIRKVAEGVAAAHALGIVHRDLKPGNVLLDGTGEPRVTDFGLARRGEGADLTATHAVMGTPAYMAPEQARGGGKFAGPPADVWALGVILYESVSGYRPFAGESDEAVLAQIGSTEPRPLRSRVPGVSKDLDTIVGKCLAKEPERRYPTAAELADDLGRFVRGELITARPVGRFERAYRWARRKPTAAALYLALSAAVVLAGVLAAVGWQWRLADLARRQGVELNGRLAGANADKDRLLGERDAALGVAGNETARAERERERVAMFEYGKAVQLAHQAVRDGDHAGGVKILEGTQEKHRGWEWHYVRRLCNTVPLATFPFGSAGGPGDGDPTEVYWSRDGRRFAAVKHHSHPQPSDVRVVDAVAGRELARITGARGEVEFSPDGRLLLTDSGVWERQGPVRVWNAETGAPVATLDGVVSARWVRDGRLLTVRAHPKGFRYFAALRNLGEPAPTDEVEVVLKPGARLPFSSGTRVLRPLSIPPVPVPFVSHKFSFLQVWDLDAGKAVALLPGGELAGSPVAWSADGTRLLFAGSSRLTKVRPAFYLWDTTAGGRVATLLPGNLWVDDYSGFTPKFSEDGRRLVIPYRCDGVRVWKVATGELLDGHSGRWEEPQAQPAPKPKLKIGSSRGDVTVLDADTGKVVTQLKLRWPGAVAATLSPDGTLLATATEEYGGGEPAVGRVRLWDARTGAPLAVLGDFTRPYGRDLEFSPDGKHVRANFEDYRVAVFDARTGQPLSEFRGHTRKIDQVEISPDGNRVVTAGDDDSVRVWEADTGLQLLMVPGVQRSAVKNGIMQARPRFDCVWGPGGLRLATVRPLRGTTVWDGATGEEQMTLPNAHRVHFDPAGTRAAVVNDPTWNSSLRGTQVLDLRPARLALRSDGHGPGLGGQIRLVSPQSTYVLTPRALAWNRDGTRLATGGSDGVVRLWDARTGRMLPVAWRYAGAVTAVEFGPGDRLVTASMDGTAHVRDAHTGVTLATLTSHASPVTAARFSPDGLRVATTALDGTTRVWTTGGEEMRAFRPLRWGNQEAPAAISAAWSPDGKRVAVGYGSPRSGYVPMAARVWEVDTGRLAATLGNGQFVEWNEDGTRLLVASSATGSPYSVWGMDSNPARLVSERRSTGGLSSPETIRIAWNSDGSRVCVPRDFVHPVQVLDATVEVKWGEPMKGESYVLPDEYDNAQWGPIAFNPSGKQLLIGNVVLDLTSKESVGKDRLGYPIRKPACVLRRTRAWKTHEGVKDVPVWDCTQAAWSPDGKRIATTHSDGSVRVWDAATGAALTTSERSHTASVQEAVWSSDGKWVLTTEWTVPPWADRRSDDATPAVTPERSCVWDARTGALLRTFPVGTKERTWPDGTPVAAVAKVGPRDRFPKKTPARNVERDILLATTADGAWELTHDWKDPPFAPAVRDATTGAVITVLKGHGKRVFGATFSPDRARVVTWSEDGTFRVWQMPTGAELLVQKGDWATYVRPDATGPGWDEWFSRYWSVSFSPDGTRLLASAPGRGVTILDATPWR